MKLMTPDCSTAAPLLGVGAGVPDTLPALCLCPCLLQPMTPTCSRTAPWATAPLSSLPACWPTWLWHSPSAWSRWVDGWVDGWIGWVGGRVGGRVRACFPSSRCWQLPRWHQRHHLGPLASSPAPGPNPLLLLFFPHPQASTVGIPEPTYLPGVKLGEMRESSVAARSGLRQGDIVLRIGKLEVAPGPGSVNAVVDKIRRGGEWGYACGGDSIGGLVMVPRCDGAVCSVRGGWHHRWRGQKGHVG